MLEYVINYCLQFLVSILECKKILDKTECNYYLETVQEEYKNKLKTKYLKGNKNIYISNVVHLIGTENNSHLYNPQPSKNIQKTEYLLEIQKILKTIDLIDEIKNKINETIDLIDENTIGIHYRSSDGSFVVK